ncbi:hypothetical protein RvY_17603 [Ramazzottius varieornatus]|uniref:ribonuclease H n=1 Tax=Ramazzottius varieornatus TaxID=947166 RepID=A0A1D1W6H0_RAMVA|nr:hypothetical protein RvY_17603 [Ramazzottius varieornatus]
MQAVKGNGARYVLVAQKDGGEGVNVSMVTRASGGGGAGGNQLNTLTAGQAQAPIFYGVKTGRHPGVYDNWPDTLKETINFKGSDVHKFPTRKAAQDYVNGLTAAPKPRTRNAGANQGQQQQQQQQQQGSQNEGKAGQKGQNGNRGAGTGRRRGGRGGQGQQPQQGQNQAKVAPPQQIVVELPANAQLARGSGAPRKRPARPAQQFFAVQNGHQPGVYTDRAAAEKQTNGHPDFVVKVCSNLAEAEHFAYWEVMPENAALAFVAGAAPIQGRSARGGGIGVYFGFESGMNVQAPLIGFPRKHRAEFIAAVRAINRARARGYVELTIISASQYLVDAMTVNWPKWKEADWKDENGVEIPDRSNIEMMLDYSQGMVVNYEFIPANMGVWGISKACQMAGIGAHISTVTTQRRRIQKIQKHGQPLELTRQNRKGSGSNGGRNGNGNSGGMHGSMGKVINNGLKEINVINTMGTGAHPGAHWDEEIRYGAVSGIGYE